MDIHEILSKYLAEVPRNLFGVEKQRAIGSVAKKLQPDEMNQVIETVHRFLLKMPEKDASDIDLGGESSRGHVWYRVYGAKNPDESMGKYSVDETNLMIQAILMESQREHLYECRNLDFSYQVTQPDGGRLRFRGDAYFDLDNIAMNMRLIGQTIRPFKDLGLHQNVARALMLKYEKRGLTLVTGITGSGKSSTLDSIIDANNRMADGHIVIIGSPIETIHDSNRCIIRHREVGRDVLSFKEGTIQALRQDPDIIVIGEMRDPETILTALEVTDSGHKVFSTLHTASAVESIDRIIGECPPAEQNRVRERLADVLRCVMSQKLVPSLDGKRVLAKEVMLMTPSIMAAIKNNNTGEIYQMIHEGSQFGMVTMEQDLKRLLESGKISKDEALNFANNKKRMEELLRS